MPTTSEVSTRLSADNSNYRSVMGQSVEVADKSAHAILKRLDIKAGVAAIAASVGISVQSISESLARTLTGFSKKEEAALASIEELSGRVADEVIAGNRRKLKYQEEYSLVLKEQERLQRKIDANVFSSLDKQVEKRKDQLALLEKQKEAEAILAAIREQNERKAAAAYEQQKLVAEAVVEAKKQDASRDAALFDARRRVDMETLTVNERVRRIKDEIAALEKSSVLVQGDSAERQQAAARLDQRRLELIEAQGAARRRGDERALELEQESFDYVKEHHRELELEAKLKLGTLLPAERTELDVLKLQTKEKTIQWEMDSLLAKGTANWTEADKQRYAVLVTQSKELGAQIALKQALIGKTAEQVDAEEKVAKSIRETKTAIGEAVTANDDFVDSMGQLFDEVSNVSKAWETFKGSISTTGRGDKELSDRELERKISQIQQDIFARQTAHPGQDDFFIGPQRSNLSQAVAELDLRRTVRTQATRFGEDFAFRNNPGISEQRLRDILGGIDTTTQGRIANGIEKLNQQLTRGVPTVLFGTDS